MSPFALIAIFVSVAVVLAVAGQVIGQTNDADRCKTLPGFVASGGDTTAYGLGTKANLELRGESDSAANGTYFYGTWAWQCHSQSDQALVAFSLLLVILVVIAAAAVIIALRQFV